MTTGTTCVLLSWLSNGTSWLWMLQILDNPVLLTNTEPGRPTFRIQPEEKPAERGGLMSWLC